MPAVKRTFPLQAAGKDDARVRDKIRHEVNKYVRRCRRQEPPEGYATWGFLCKVGPTAAAAADRALKEVAGEIDAVALAGAKTVYIELIATPAQRRAAPDMK